MKVKNIVLRDFTELDMTRYASKSVMPMITIHRHPADYPDKYVARLWTTGVGGPQATPFIIIRDTLDEIRGIIPAGMACFARDRRDVLAVVETWL